MHEKLYITIMRLLFLVILFVSAYSAFAKRLHPEAAYQAAFASTIPNAKTEVVAPDGTRCDILTDEYAIEVDFSDKWAEAIGQSLNYAIQFNKQAGIVLILENQKDYKYYIRVNTIINHFKLPITIWIVDPTNINININKNTSQPLATPQSNTPPATSTTNQIYNDENQSYWISKTGKRHNSSCRYYKNCRGRPGTKNDGIACKLCGG